MPVVLRLFLQRTRTLRGRLLRGTQVALCIVEIARDDDRSASLIAQLTLRRLVAARTGIPLEAVLLGRDERGPPIVLNPMGLRATISHSGSMIACAVAGREVGVDIERDDRAEADEPLADRVCTPDERVYLRATPAAKRRRALVRLWARKEAFAKGLGMGLELPFGTLDVLRDMPVVAGAPQAGWVVRDVGAPSGYLAAIAVRARHCSIQLQTIDV